MFDVKNAMKENPILWNNFKFHIKWNKNGVVRIYIGDKKTKYYTNGGGYDKESSVIASMINDIIGACCSIGVSFEYTKKYFKQIGGKLDIIYYGDNFNVYEIDFSGINL